MCPVISGDMKREAEQREKMRREERRGGKIFKDAV
jgi:hypothetical protein